MAQQEENTALRLPVDSVSEENVRNGPEKIHFLEPFIVLTKHKFLVVGFPVVCGCIAAVVSLFLRPVYTATTKIMPPQQNQSISAAMLGQLGPLAGIAGKDLGIRNPSDLYIAMLRSRTVSDSLIQKFALMTVYRAKKHIDAERTLESATEINAGKEGIISVSVSDRDPQRSADMANAYVKELENLSETLAVTEAGRRRLFFEREVTAANNDLANAEQMLKKTQEATGIIQLDNQSKAMIESLTTLHAQVAAKDAEVRAMQAYATPENPDLVRAEQELSAMRSELARVESGQAGASLTEIPVRKVPEAALEYLRKLREVKYREALLELLTKQYEIARIDEARDAAIIQVMDKALPPETRSWPHRTVIVLAVAFVAFFVAIVLAFVFEAVEHARGDPEFSARLQLFKFYLAKGPQGLI